MSEYFSKLFRASSPKANMRHAQRKQIPKDFAQQILQNDIILVLSEYTNDDALRNLINLYMLGVEHFKEIQDQSYKYFQIQLNKLILNPVVTQTPIPPQQKPQESPKIQKKNLPLPKIDVNIQQNQEIQDQQYSKTAVVMRDIQASTFNFNEDSITETINQKINNKHNNNNTSSVDLDHELLQNDIQNRVQSQQDERKENMTLDLKQQLFLFDENKEASDLIDQYKSDQQKIEKIKNDQISKQTTAFLMKLSQRNNKRKMNTQIVTNINRYNSQPTLQNQNGYNSEQRPIEEQIIPEDKNESSSKITSSDKNTKKFQFDELQDS
ncbi:unnamed protein product [Paramecium pentaurelia]|uniref:Uncharacterized protein n=1 Tax=Paramecium pentaurelia TaxID=43138 RepID=A0A8S1WZ94_9CILI|nr:unnamed protein product [Paramecium pentaurelia]